MSYDLAVWYASRPITTQEAGDIYLRLAAEGLADVEPHPGIQAFLAELTARSPPFDDWGEDEIDNCMWSAPFDCSDRHILMSIAFSRADEITSVVEELAAKHDLVYFDPQLPGVFYPPRVAAMPHLRLSLENFTLIDNPTPDDIAESLASLDTDENSFAILERTTMTYIQTKLQSPGEFLIEFQDGSRNEHYRAVVRNAQKVTAMFVAYAAGHNIWKRQCRWRKISL